MGTFGRKWVRWSAKRREAFLDHLAGTCNVKEAAAAVGVDPGCVYYLRRQDASFAEAWREALTLGYDMLETQLIGHAMANDGSRMIRNGAMGEFDVDLALRLLSHHRNAMQGKPFRGGPKLRRATREETDEAILRKIDAIERSRNLAP